ncbi:MAG: hypothetical protein MK211_05175 [Flavobacteriales bacterium]|jgi:hypothetical protein|uniref:DUF6702 family protein n=1 Tax=Candidatus Ulvibacter alkanivorans TaxID=2267620 RepID=UPI000DF1D3D3|nr:DUF6702 family protein [Candidatus Ulvibacter alkanivorans]MCH2489523.1 hypothetical protein [Flavobacteriales bacterium]
MKFVKVALILFLFPLLTASTAHKFYVSITKIEHVEETESLQIITKIFIDDIEDVLQKRYDPNVSLATTKEREQDAALLKKYILQKLKIKVNGKPVTYDYIGRKYETDVVKSFIEVKGVKDINSIEIENKVLMDLFPEQQNIVHVKTDSNRRSLLLDADNPKGLLNFN